MAGQTDTIKALHVDGWKGIRNILFKKGTFSKLPVWISFSASVGLAILLISTSPQKSFQYVHETIELILAVFPSLLGFSLGGYALVVGFSNFELIKAGTKTDKYSIYQILNAIFALCILLQVATILISFIVSWTIRVNPFGVTSFPAGFIGDVINCIVLFAVTFSALYSLLLTPFVVTNLFTLSQTNNSYFTIRKIVEQREKRRKEEEEEEMKNNEGKEGQ